MDEKELYKKAIDAFKIKKNENIWIFGYGSLMWNPGFSYLQALPAHLCGYHRRFCIYSKNFRGTKENPGLFLGLDRGGSCRGMAFEVDYHHLEEALPVLWMREMHPTLPTYKAKRVPILVQGHMQEKISACTFVTEREHPHYFNKRCIDTTASLIKSASGIKGSNLEYLKRTVYSLREIGIYDPLLENLFHKTDE